MKKSWLVLIAVIAFVPGYAFLSNSRAEAENPPAKAAKAPAKASCKNCHADFTLLLPSKHPPIKGNDLAACVICHKTDMPDTQKKNVFFTRIHLGHLPPKGQVNCLICHHWSAGKNFGLIGIKESWGVLTKEDMDTMKENFTSWAASEFMDNLHAQAGISCANCHGKELPKAESTLTNQQCLVCHGSVDELALKTEPKDFKDRNPHKSHLGEIACTVCHKAHQESKVYCLECHQQFKMTIPGAGSIKK